MLGVRVGDDQRERGEVVAGDPGGAARRRARRSGTAAAANADRRRSAKPTRSTALPLGADRVAASPVGSNTVSNDGPVRPSSRWRSSTGNPGVRPQLGLGATRLLHQRPPRAGSVVSGQGSGRPTGRRERSRSPRRARRTARRAPSRARPAAPTAAAAPSSSATRRTAARGRLSGSRTSCSATPGTGSSVHRGIAVLPPAVSTPRQNFAAGFGQRVHRVVLDQCGHRAPPRAAGVVVTAEPA